MGSWPDSTSLANRRFDSVYSCPQYTWVSCGNDANRCNEACIIVGVPSKTRPQPPTKSVSPVHSRFEQIHARPQRMARHVKRGKRHAPNDNRLRMLNRMSHTGYPMSIMLMGPYLDGGKCFTHFSDSPHVIVVMMSAKYGNQLEPQVFRFTQYRYPLRRVDDQCLRTTLTMNEIGVVVERASNDLHLHVIGPTGNETFAYHFTTTVLGTKDTCTPSSSSSMGNAAVFLLTSASRTVTLGTICSDRRSETKSGAPSTRTST